jgi:hypothetical protein
MQKPTRMDQHPAPVTAIQTAAGLTEPIGRTKTVLERGQRPTPVTAIQTAAGFDKPTISNLLTFYVIILVCLPRKIEPI